MITFHTEDVVALSEILIDTHVQIPFGQGHLTGLLCTFSRPDVQNTGRSAGPCVDLQFSITQNMRVQRSRHRKRGVAVSCDSKNSGGVRAGGVVHHNTEVTIV